jgi:regulatory protein
MDGKIFKITAIKAQARNRQRVNIYLDGEYGFTLDRIVAAWLNVGDDLSEQRIAQLTAQDENEKTYQQALRFLSYRPRSETEMTVHLQKKGLNAEAINETMIRLKNNQLIDDKKFAENWIENRIHSRNRSRRGLAMELHRQGVADPIVENALESTYGNEQEIAMRAALKMAYKLRGMNWQDFRRKMISRLMYRQFTYEMALEVTRRIWEEIKEAEKETEEDLK